MHPHTLMGGSFVKWMEEEQGEIWLMDELAQYVSAAKTGLMLQFGPGWQEDRSERNAPSQLCSGLVVH